MNYLKNLVVQSACFTRKKFLYKNGHALAIFSIFNSYLSYGLPVWGNADKIYLEKIFLLQKRAIRAITFADYNAHTLPLFKELKILSLVDLYEYQLSSLMWDLDHNILPNALTINFSKRKNDHTHLTRMATAESFQLKNPIPKDMDYAPSM